MNDYRIEFTFLETCAAAYALLGVDDVGLLYLALDGSCRTCPGTRRTTLAAGRINGIYPEGTAPVGRTTLVHDVGHIFVIEVVESGKHRIGRSLAETAEGRILDYLAEILEVIQILHRTLALGNLFKYLLQTFVAYTARSALSA